MRYTEPGNSVMELLLEEYLRTKLHIRFLSFLYIRYVYLLANEEYLRLFLSIFLGGNLDIL